METVTLLFIGVAVIVVIAFFARRKWQGNLPPEKPGLPVVGHLFSPAYKSYQTYVDDLSLGDIYIYNLGFVSFVRLNSHTAVIEGLVGQADAFSGRDKSTFTRELCHGSGIVNTEGRQWQEHRQLMVRVMRNLGEGRSTITEIVQEEVTAMNDLLGEMEGRPMESTEIFSCVTNNVISRLIFGERYGSEDPKFREFNEHLIEAERNFNCINPINLIPMLFPLILKFNCLKRQLPIFYHIESLYEYIREKIEAQRDAMQSMEHPPTDVRDASNICEAFLIEQASQENANPGGHTFTDWQLIAGMTDLFGAGTDSTATALRWATLLLASHPEVQQQLQSHIRERLGRQRLPSMDDRRDLPYVCAVMDEVLRYSSLIPLNVFHRTTRDVKILGYHLPADSVIQCNLYGIHHDPIVWKRPNDFYPGHFLSQEGEYERNPCLLPFSAGKRVCLGESLARTEFFVALVGMMQQFTVRMADPEVDLKPILEGEMGFIRHPGPHKVIFERLNSAD